MPNRARAQRKPVVWSFSLSRLSQLVESVIPEYAGRCEIRIIDKAFEDALATARELMKAREVDVFLAAGSNGAFLREHASVPVVLVSPSGLDLLHALATARRISQRVGVVTYGGVTPELEELRAAFGLQLEQRSYRTTDQITAIVRELAARGVEVVVGPGVVLDEAQRLGLAGVSDYSQRSVREALDQAIEMARVAHLEEARRERVNTILRHLNEGVVAVDMEERIQSINPAMERLLGVGAEKAVGQRLSSLAPPLGLARVVESGAPELEQIQRLGGRTLVTNRIPLRERGAQTGAVLTCQDSSAIERVDRRLRSQHRPRRFVARHQLADLVGDSPAMRQVKALAARYARTDATVLITGASGTGKELVAQGIHNASGRRAHPFVAVNCAAFPETLLESELFGYDEGAFTGSRRGGKPGLFEAAHTGTLFLDEVGDVPVALQTRLLRVLQEREVLRLGSYDPTPVDVRVLAATNHDLRRLVREGRFREDLYYRLDILHLHLPPLRERRDDLQPLAAHLLGRALARHGAERWRDRVFALVLPGVERHAWPGNVRELENVLERAAVLWGGAEAEGEVEAAELRAVAPELFGGAAAAAAPEASPPLEGARRSAEQEEIRRVLDACGGNRSEAARRLGIGRTTLWRKMAEG